jgi:competence protein ComEC
MCEWLGEKYIIPLLLVFLTLLCFFTVVSIKNNKNNYSRRWVFGILFSIFMFLSSTIIMHLHWPDSVAKDEIEILNNVQMYQGRIVSDPKLKDYGYRYEVELECRYLDSTLYICNRKLMMYHSSSLEFANPKYGQMILFTAQLDTIQGPRYAHEFDYKQYLFRKNIHYRGYPQNVLLIDSGRVEGWGFVRQVSYRIRDNLIRKLQDSELGKEELAVASAVLLGYDDFLNQDLRESFQHAGAVHMLCVSGLHVGILFLIMKLLLGFLSRKHWHRILKTLLLLVIIWTYSFVTGMAPSTQRASLMISILILGELFRAKYDSLNSLLVSAFIMLLYDPFLLFNIGFQLSHLAVFSILVLYPRFNSKIQIKNLILRKIWQASLVSVAANIGTFPIVLYNFASFPNYFLISNIVVSFFAAPILFIGFTYLLLGLIPFIGTILSWGLKYTIHILIVCIKEIDSLPFSTWDIQIDGFSTVILYLLIIFGYLFLRSKTVFLLRGFLVTLICLSVHANVKAYIMWGYSGISHLEYKEIKAVAMVSKRVASIYYSGEIKEYDKFKTYVLSPYLNHYKIRNYEIRFVESKIFPDKIPFDR